MIIYSLVFLASSTLIVISFYFKSRFLTFISVFGGASSNLFLTKPVGDIGNHVGNMNIYLIQENSNIYSQMYLLLELLGVTTFYHIKIFLFITTLIIPIIFHKKFLKNHIYSFYYFYVFIPYYTNYLTHGFGSIIFIILANSLLFYFSIIFHHALIFNIIFNFFLKLKKINFILLILPINIVIGFVFLPRLTQAIEIYSNDVLDRLSVNSLMSLIFYVTFTYYFFSHNYLVLNKKLVNPSKNKIILFFSFFTLFELFARIYISLLLLLTSISFSYKRNKLFEIFIIIILNLKLILHLYRSYIF